MSDNPQAAPAQEFALPGHDVLSITGRDAVAFAQAQFMNDVAALDAGHWHWNGWLTPKGRVIALFALLKLDAETLWLLLPDVDARELAAQLQRYVFRSKLVLAPVDTRVSAMFDVPVNANGSTFSRDEAGMVELDMGGDDGPRSLRIGTASAREDADAIAHWDAFDLAHGLPRLPASQAEQWTPQQLSLDRLRAFSVKKGCYPGQEIVARTHFLGQVKRGLALFRSEMPLTAGADVHDGERMAGSIVSACGMSALAVLPLARDGNAFSVEGAPVQEQPLLDGLAR